MDNLTARIAAEQEDQIRREALAMSRRRAAAARQMGGGATGRPDRVALWAFLMAIAVTIAAAASAQAATSGGIATTSPDQTDRRHMEKETATWYGPGLWGNETACGKTLERKTVGVAHRRLPCGTEVTFAYKGNYLTTKVIDRGPFANGARWDLTQAAARKLEFEATDQILVSVGE